MRILVIGGTVFVGRHFVAAALQNGHDVTLFHRGSKGPGLIPGTSEIFGDRDGDIQRAAGQTWDAVVDCCGYFPRIVSLSAEALKDEAKRYLFVSTISVYDTKGQDRLSENSTLLTLEDPTVEEVTGETYGGLKVLCERAVTDAFGDRATIIRPGLIIGPHDPSNRFTYWVDRLASGGEALVPNRSAQPLQLIDARDLGQFMLTTLENDLSGIYNACGPDEPKTFGDMIAACHCANLGTELVWVDPAALAAHEVSLWQDLPLSLPEDGEAMMRTDNRRAIAAGLTFRSWERSAEDTLEWRRTLSEGPGRHGMGREREQEVLRTIRATPAS